MASPDSDPRVLFAAERTLLAWIRTGLTLMAFGFVVSRFAIFLRMLSTGPRPVTIEATYSAPLGVSFVAMGTVVVLAAAWEHAVFRRRYFAGEPLPLRLGLVGVLLGLGIGAAGVLLSAFLFHSRPM